MVNNVTWHPVLAVFSRIVTGHGTAMKRGEPRVVMSVEVTSASTARSEMNGKNPTALTASCQGSGAIPLLCLLQLRGPSV